MAQFNFIILQPRIGNIDPCILIKVQNKNILINCPGGTQRIFNSYGLNLNNIDYIIITKSTCEHIEGILGFLMTSLDKRQNRLQIFYYYDIGKDIQFTEKFYRSINDYTYASILNGDTVSISNNQTIYVEDELFTLNLSVKNNKMLIQLKPSFFQEKLNQNLKDKYNLGVKHFKELRQNGFIIVNETKIEKNNVFQKKFPDYLEISTEEVKILSYQTSKIIHQIELKDEKTRISYPIAKFIEFYNSQQSMQKIRFDPKLSQQLNQYTVFPPKQSLECINLITQELESYQQLLEQGKREHYVKLNSDLSPTIGNRFILLMLGTGCSVPSKYNNVQAQLLIDRQDNVYYLIDCGEGTLEQLNFSNVKIEDMENLVILFTHEHADHYLGISSFLVNYLSIFGIIPPIVCQGLIFYYIYQTMPQNVDVLSKLNDSLMLEVNQIFIIPTRVPDSYGINFLQNLPQDIKNQQIYKFDFQNSKIYAFRTNHTPDSVCYLLQIGDYKIMFSGDLQPLHTQKCWTSYEEYFVKKENEKLIIIHEATYMENERENAIKNAHSVYQDVLDFKNVVKADLLFITHFSVRHCKEKLIDDNTEKQGVIQCYDYIQHDF